MANNNVQNVKFLRNGVVFGPSNDPVKTAREVALDAMEKQKANLADGTAILGRYQETNGIVKTLVGFAYISGETKTLTVFDVDGASADVDEKIKTAIEALDSNATSLDGKNIQVKVTETDGKITAVNITTDNTVNSDNVANAIEGAISKLDGSVVAESGFYVKSVTEADGKISGTTEALPSLEEVKEIGKPIVAVSENKGQVAASAGNINAKYVDVSYTAITATNVKGALAEIADEIDGMDLPVVSGDGEVITAVSEEDGKVSASKTAIKDVKLTNYVKNTTATGAISATDDIEDALSKLENKAAAITIANADGSINVTTGETGTDINVNIKSGEKVLAKTGNAGLYTDIKLNGITPSSTTVKEEFALIGTDGSQLGTSIKVYKDSHIVSITYITDSGSTHYQNLEYKYIDANGIERTAYVDISSLVLEAEFASGVTFSNGVAHGVVDPTSETFLTVGANGFKVDGIKGEIDTKIKALDATVSGKTADGRVNVKVTEADGVITAVDVVGTDIASAQGLADEITARGNADTELSNRLGANVTTANTASAQLSALSGTSEDASGVTSVNGAKKYAKQYADEKVAAVVDGLDATVSGKTADGRVNVKVTEADGVITAVDVVGTDIASAQGLADEIAARKAVDGQNGQTYTANSGKTYISGATSLNDADVKLNDALASLDTDVIKSVKVNDVKLDETSNAVNVQISSVKASGTDSSPIVVNTDNTGVVTLQILQIDCGEY